MGIGLTDLLGLIGAISGVVAAVGVLVSILLSYFHWRNLSARNDTQSKLLGDRMNDVGSKIDQVWGFLAGKFPKAFPGFSVAGAGVTDTVGSNSPLTLTPKGQKLAMKMNATQIVDKYVHMVLVSADEDYLGIQEACMLFAHTNLITVVSDDERNIIRRQIYEDAGNAGNVLGIFGILFRDAILASRDMAVPKASENQEAPAAP